LQATHVSANYSMPYYVYITARYGISQLVYFEEFERIGDAIAREKKLKRWRRAWKLKLIEALNPSWRDFYLDFV